MTESLLVRRVGRRTPGPIYRAPMAARDVDLPRGTGAAYGVERGLVGIGGLLVPAPATLGDALVAMTEAHGTKAARGLLRFAELPAATLMWTRTPDGAFRLGRIDGPWRYDDDPAARRVGLPHVRAAAWHPRSFTAAEVPAAVAATFARGGRNLQRTHDEPAERRSEELWATGGSRAGTSPAA
jgi:hypothetical protein